MSKNAVVLLSGGIDSSTTLSIAKDEGFDLFALSFRYGQRNTHELNAAKNIARLCDVKEHLILKTDLSSIGGSALTTDIPVPEKESEEKNDGSVPITYVPARNTIFLSFALAWAETLDASDIFIGVNAMDYSGYPDCRPEFIEAFQRLANIGTKAGMQGRRFKIHTPLIRMTKAQIIKKGTALGVAYSLTRSCYDPDDKGRACGRCESCFLRKKGFQEAGIPDPTDYQA